MKLETLFAQIFVLLCLLGCVGRRNGNPATTKGEAPLPTPPISLRIISDTVHVDGALYAYGDSLMIPLIVNETDCDSYYDTDDEGERMREARLRNDRKVCLQFTSPIHGYAVQVTLHPDEGHDEVGMGEWRLSKGKDTLKIDTGFYWDWKEVVADQVVDSIRYSGEIYRIAPSHLMIQGRDSVIFNTPFCFKDVDFDGEDEICFRAGGWNRYYFNAYKILSRCEARLMEGEPYNNLVYSQIENCTSEFGYTNQEISIHEQSGVGRSSSHRYKRRARVTDTLNPMQHISGYETEYSSSAFHHEEYFENGKWVKSVKTYRLDYTGAYADTEIIAEYVAEKEMVFALKKLILHDRDNNFHKTLYEK